MGPYLEPDGCGHHTLGNFEKSKMAAIFTEMAITPLLFVIDGSCLHLSLYFRGQPIH